MKNECSIVKDLLPLYREEMVSRETAAFVAAHLRSCGECRAELERLDQPLTAADGQTPGEGSAADIGGASPDAEPLRRLRRTLRRKRAQTVLCTAALLLALILSLFGYLTAPSFFAWTPGLADVSETPDGLVVLSFDEKVSGYRSWSVYDMEEEADVWRVEAWTTAWDRLFPQKGRQNAVFCPEDGCPMQVWFVQNTVRDGADTEDVLLYGQPKHENTGAVTLPRLWPGYMLILAFGLLFVLAAALLVLRKNERARLWLERLLTLPASYILAHLCVLQFRTVSYAVGRDFCLIAMIALLICCALLFAESVLRSRTALRRMERDRKTEDANNRR